MITVVVGGMRLLTTPRLCARARVLRRQSDRVTPFCSAQMMRDTTCVIHTCTYRGRAGPERQLHARLASQACGAVVSRGERDQHGYITWAAGDGSRNCQIALVEVKQRAQAGGHFHAMAAALVQSLLQAEFAAAPVGMEEELSSSTLFKLLDKLKQRGKQVQRQIAATAAQERERITQVFDDAAVRDTEIDAASAALSEIVEEVLGPVETMEATLASAVTDLQATNDALKRNAQIIAAVEVLAKISEQFDLLGKHVLPRQLPAAAVALQTISVQLEKLPHTPGPVAIVESARQMHLERVRTTEQALATEFAHALSVRENEIVIATGGGGPHLAVSHLLAVAHYLNQLEVFWDEKFCGSIALLVDRICNCGATLRVQKEVDKLVLQWDTPCEETDEGSGRVDDSKVEQIMSAFTYVHTLVRSIHECVLDELTLINDEGDEEQQGLGKQLLAALWGKTVSRGFISHCLVSASPSVPSELPAVRKLAVRLAECESGLAALGLRLDDINSTACALEADFSKRKRQEQLLAARQLLMDSSLVGDHMILSDPSQRSVLVPSVQTASGSSSDDVPVTMEQLASEAYPFILNECTVSTKSMQLVVMAHTVLREACGSTVEYAMQCIQTTKDLLQLPIALGMRLVAPWPFIVGSKRCC
eukprot:scaffold1265_cov366-Prasinococcus_capsulatus_cf.AAC.20